MIYQSPTEGVSVFGTVICLSCKDAEKVKVGMDRMQRAFEALASGPMKVRKKMIAGVEVREIYARDDEDSDDGRRPGDGTRREKSRDQNDQGFLSNLVKKALN